MSFVLQYTMQDEKTVANDGNKYVTGINCTPQSAYTEFNNTKRLYGKTDGDCSIISCSPFRWMKIYHRKRHTKLQ